MLTSCARCRLREIIRHQSWTRQRRQAISYQRPQRQGEQAGEYVDALLAKFDQSLNRPRKRRSGKEQSPTPSTQSGGGAGSIRGRYSGRPLQENGPDGGYSDGKAPEQGRERDNAQERPRSWQDWEHAAAARTSAQRQSPQEMLEHLAMPHNQRRPTRPSEEKHEKSATMISNHASEDAGYTTEGSRSKPSYVYLGSPTRKRLPPRLVELADEFLKTGDNPAKLTCLQALVGQLRDRNDLRVLGRDRYFGRALFYLTLATTDAFVASASSHDTPTSTKHLPTPAILLRIRSEMTEDPSAVWPNVLWSLAKHVAKLRVDGKGASAVAGRSMQELMAVWSSCMKSQHYRGREPPPLPSTEELLNMPSVDFSFLPDAERFGEGLREQGSFYMLSEVLDFLVPPLAMVSNSRDYDFPSAALVTLDLLQDSEVPVEQSYESWRKLMESVVKHASGNRMPPALPKAAAESNSDGLRKYFGCVVDKFGLRAPPRDSDDQSFPGEGTASTDPGPASNQELLQSIDRPAALTHVSSDFDRRVVRAVENLDRALQEHKLAYAHRTWTDVQDSWTSFPKHRTPLHLFERLLMTFLALRDHTAAMKVWQAMIQAGHRPVVKQYTIAMNGCRYIRAPRMLEAFWAHMRKTGVQPDNHAWSTRVFTLFNCREVDAGFRALSEMSREWISAAREVYAHRTAKEQARTFASQEMTPLKLAKLYPEDIGGVVRPNEVVLNAAISAISSKDDGNVQKVLEWAGSFGIQANLNTYNALLNIAMRRGRPREALDILQHMDNRSIEADGTTWTVLLTALFEGGFLENLDHAAQQEKIVAFITSLDAANAARIDLKGYALIIDRLLKHYSNHAAADAVLQYMIAHKVQPTPHIYTILMTAHFASPVTGPSPDFQAIEALWATMRSANAARGVALDAQFYDRMIEGYATHHVAAGSTKRMLYFLERMQGEGKKPSWKALSCVLRALAERGEWQRAESVLGNAKREVSTRWATVSRFGHRDFWIMVEELGLLGMNEARALSAEGERRLSEGRRLR